MADAAAPSSRTAHDTPVGDAGPPRSAPSGGAGLRDLLGRLAASIASTVDTRVQLAALEFAEERDRARDRLVLVLIAAIAAGLALIALNALIVAVLWDRFGWGSLLGLTALWGAVAGIAVWRLAQASRREQGPFAATLAEFERDRVWLLERFGTKR
jgi:uncharacterized membrane protein YqjE